MIQEYVDTSN